MLKHVSLSPWRGRADSLSLASGTGCGGPGGCGDPGSCGSGSPTPGDTPPPSRASSCASLAALTSLSPADAKSQQTTIKVYANCLRPDIEYKTLSITYATTCREIVRNLLNKYRMRHRDPKLFYMTMEVTVRRANVRTILPLDEDARPAVLQSCHPRGDSRFSLQTRRGGLVKIYDSALMSGSKYKSLLISERTTVDELIQMLLSCYGSTERVERFSLYEVCEAEEYQRKLHPDDSPLRVTQRWTDSDHHLRIRRNPDYVPHVRKSTWTSDSAVAMAMSRLHLRTATQLRANSDDHDRNDEDALSPHQQHRRHHSHQYNNRSVARDDNNNNDNDPKSDHDADRRKEALSRMQTARPPTSVAQFSRGVPSSPITASHLSKSSPYSTYENYFFI
ncbi:uncharacterized protein LOC105704499 [Orussus abietinus]|uniref:uncharacterized protein LOC105704499 n=1 Tax=Orussus abietinus TaxID=222816 RepID=UPI000626BD1E|nr:uncharacterized protein LOC105704499 [Orussus abietinus]